MHVFVFWSYAVIVAWLSLRQGDGPGITPPLDKVLHVLVYYIFAVFAYRILKQGRGFVWVCLAIVAYGALLEVAQASIPGRYMSMQDMAANALGVALGALVVTRKRG